MKNISGIVANALWLQGIIGEEDIDTCRYGLYVFIASAIEIASILIISVFTNNFLKTLLFFTAFIPLRVYAGGYHADTKLKCYLLSLGVYTAFTIVTEMISKDIYAVVNLSASIISLIIVLSSAPVIHKNKAINNIEKKYYQKFSICICAVETAIILILTAILPKSPYIVSLAIGQVAVAISMIAAKIKGKTAVNK